MEEPEVQVFDLSDILERAIATAWETALITFYPFMQLTVRDWKAVALTVGTAAGGAALSVLRNAVRQYRAASRRRVQF